MKSSSSSANEPDLCVEDESPMETEAKLKAVDAYNVILDERMKRKKLLVDKRLYDQKYQTAVDRMKSSEQKAISDLLKPLYKYIYVSWNDCLPPLFSKDHKLKSAEPVITETEIEDLVDFILEDRELTERLNILSAWREADLKTVQDVLERGKAIVDRYRQNMVCLPTQ